MADLRALTDACVHCGFCLPACPTYQLWGEEMDSPRGRIHLARQLADGASVTASIAGHLDACLGCLACVPACPSGVRYDEILEHARGAVEASRGVMATGLRAAVFGLFPYPQRLRALRAPLGVAQKLGLLRLAGRIHPALGAAADLAPPLRPRVLLPGRLPARPGGRPGRRRAVVGLLTGCVQAAFFSHVTAAVARVLCVEGCDVVIPAGQGCCGALAHHAGRHERARRQARQTVATFVRAGVDAVVTDVAGCGSMMKEYGRLLADDRTGPWAARVAAKVRDVTQLLVDLGAPLTRRHPLPYVVAYHDACHLAHGQGVRNAPRRLLRGIPELSLVSARDSGGCCGSAGVYNLLRPDAAVPLGDRTASAIRATGADMVVAGNPGCLLQIRAALRRDGGPALPAMHTIELLDASLRGLADPRVGAFPR